MRAAVLVLATCFLLPVSLPQQPDAGKGAGEQLDPKIPPADREQYKSVRDAKDWANPYLVILVDGVEIISKAIPSGRKTVAVKELQKTLVKLPVSAWPYGRVVAAQENSIRSDNDDELIEKNKRLAEDVLKKMQLKVEWWP